MYLKIDYSKNNMGMGEVTDQKNEAVKTEKDSNKDMKLEQYLEYIRIAESKFEKKFSFEKEKKFLRIYEALKEEAFISSGRVMLDIDEEKMIAKLVYWCPGMVMVDDSSNLLRDILIEIIHDCRMIYIEKSNDGIQWVVKDRLFDKEITVDESKELAEIRTKIKAIK